VGHSVIKFRGEKIDLFLNNHGVPPLRGHSMERVSPLNETGAAVRFRRVEPSHVPEGLDKPAPDRKQLLTESPGK